MHGQISFPSASIPTSGSTSFDFTPLSSNVRWPEPYHARLRMRESMFLSILLDGLVLNCAQRHLYAGGTVVRTEFHKRRQIMSKTVRLLVYFSLRIFGFIPT